MLEILNQLSVKGRVFKVNSRIALILLLAVSGCLTAAICYMSRDYINTLNAVEMYMQIDKKMHFRNGCFVYGKSKKQMQECKRLSDEAVD